MPASASLHPELPKGPERDLLDVWMIRVSARAFAASRGVVDSRPQAPTGGVSGQPGAG